MAGWAFEATIVFWTLGFGASGALSQKVDINPTFTPSQFAPGKPIHMVAYGDMRFTDPSVTSGTNPRVRKWLAERVAQEHPEAMVLTGDMPYTGSEDADWKVFQDETASWRAANILLLPAIGNHEAYRDVQKGIANYLKNFPGIGGHRFYSMLMGNLEVISLDMTSPSGGTSEQATWFQAQLDHIPRQVQFLFIIYHVPWVVDEQSQLFTNLPSKEALTLRHMLDTHMAKIKAKVVVFNGHIHNYERFERYGVEYIITGGGGAEPYPVLLRGSADLYKGGGFPVYHYLTIDISNGRLHAVMWKVKDPDAATLTVEAKDEFTLEAPTATRKVPTRQDAPLPRQ